MSNKMSFTIPYRSSFWGKVEAGDWLGTRVYYQGNAVGEIAGIAVNGNGVDVTVKMDDSIEAKKAFRVGLFGGKDVIEATNLAFNESKYQGWG